MLGIFGISGETGISNLSAMIYSALYLETHCTALSDLLSNTAEDLSLFAYLSGTVSQKPNL